MISSLGLYYPYFLFPSDNWIKLAALYWDRMGRVIPTDYENFLDDSDVVRALSGENSFIINAPPEYMDLNDVSIEFLKVLVSRIDSLKHFYSVNSRSTWPDVHNFRTSSDSPDPKLSYIYVQKMDGELSRYLVKEKLAIQYRDGWIGMHPKLASVYMAALVEKIARRRNLSPVTNENENLLAHSGFSCERIAQLLLPGQQIDSTGSFDDEVEVVLANIAIENVIPKDISKVSIDQIISLRESQPGSRRKFQAFIHSIVDDTPNLKGGQVKEYLYYHAQAEYETQISPLIQELKDNMRSTGIDLMPSIVSMQFKIPELLTPAVIEAFGIVNHDPIIQVAGATAALAIGFQKILADKRKTVKSYLEESDVTYLLNISEAFSPLTSVTGLTSRVRKVFIGI